MKQVMDYIMATKLKGYAIECLKEYYEDDPADVKWYSAENIEKT